MTSPQQPARIPILDDNDRLFAEFLPLVPPTGWGGGGPTPSVDNLAGTGLSGRDVMRAATAAEIRTVIGTAANATATDAVAGVVELATDAEARAGTDAVRVVTPAGLAAAVGDQVNTTPVEWYPRAGGLAANVVDMANGTWPPHPVTGRVFVYYGNPAGRVPTQDGNRVTGGGGMDVVRQPPDRYISL